MSDNIFGEDSKVQLKNVLTLVDNLESKLREQLEAVTYIKKEITTILNRENI
jgi:hypothetical protein